MMKSGFDPSRRDALKAAGAGVITVTALSIFGGAAYADAAAVDDAIKRLVGDRTPQEGRITLDLPQIAENGNTVPIAFEIDSPMTADDYVKSVHIFAEGNPLPDVASFHFSPACGVAQASCRMRLARTQNVIAVAEMSDGSVYMSKAEVKVTIGGCGG